MKYSFTIAQFNSAIIVFMIFAFPLIALINYFFSITSSSISYGYRVICLLVSVYIIIYNVFKGNNKFNFVFIPLMLFWIFYLYRMINDLFYSGLFSHLYNSQEYYIIYAIGISFIPMCAMFFIKTIDWIFMVNAIKKVVQIIVFLIMMIVIYRFLFYRSELIGKRLWIERDGFEFLNPITISIYSSLLILIIIYKQRANITDYFFCCFSVILIYLSASRGPAIFLVLIFIIILFLKPSIFAKRHINLAIKILIVGLLFVFSIFSQSTISNRIVEKSDGSTVIRSEIYNNAINQIKNNLLFGSHFLELKTKSSAHNFFLDIFLSTGILGFFLILPGLLLFFIIMFKRKFVNIILVLGFYFFLTIQTSGAIFNLTEFWPLFGLIISKHDELRNNILH